MHMQLNRVSTSFVGYVKYINIFISRCFAVHHSSFMWVSCVSSCECRDGRVIIILFRDAGSPFTLFVFLITNLFRVSIFLFLSLPRFYPSVYPFSPVSLFIVSFFVIGRYLSLHYLMNIGIFSILLFLN